MNKQTIQYTANYGKFRNLAGNWFYQQVFKDTTEDPRLGKKQYPTKKCQIQKYQMLNVGETYLPRVSDLILDVSDIPGTHTDTIKSQAVRNRLIAKEMRENKERQAMKKQASVESNHKQRLMRAQYSLPKQSYHYTQKQNNPERIKTQENQFQTKSKKLNKLSTLPDDLGDASDKYCDEYLKKFNNDIGNRVSQRSAPKSTSKLLENDNELCMASKKMSLIDAGRTILDDDSKDNAKLALKQRLAFLSQSQTPKPIDGHNIESCNILVNGLKSRRSRMDNDFTQHRVQRINPTFLSFGSEYLTDQNNYLAKYRNKSVVE